MSVANIFFDPFESPWGPLRSTVDKPTGTSDETQFVIPRQEQPSLLNDVRAFRSAVDAHEVAILKAALDQHRFNQRATAKALGLTYDQLRHCLRKLGLLCYSLLIPLLPFLPFLCYLHCRYLCFFPFFFSSLFLLSFFCATF